jgi:hypothetical protein
MKPVTMVLLSVVMAALLAGCGGRGKISQENFEKVKEGMTQAQVVALLGAPSGSEVVAEVEGRKTVGLVWRERGTKIVIAFSPEGKLSMRSIETE